MFGFNELILNKACLQNAADATNIITVGNVEIPGVAYANGSAINALSADVWTDVQDINPGDGNPFKFQIRLVQVGSVMTPFGISLGAETTGDYIRAQWELDGVVVMDITVGPSKAQSVRGLAPNVATLNDFIFPEPATSRFRVRLYKHGTIDQAGSVIGIGAIRYQGVTL